MSEQDKIRTFLQPPPVILGVQMRTYSAATEALMDVIAAPLLQKLIVAAAAVPEDKRDEWLTRRHNYHMGLAFLFIHGAPVDDVLDAIWDIKTFYIALLKFGEPYSVDDVVSVSEQIISMRAAASAHSRWKIADDGTPPKN